MAVFRVEKTKDFTVMCNHHLRNVKLSLKAKGLLSLMHDIGILASYDPVALDQACVDLVYGAEDGPRKSIFQNLTNLRRLKQAIQHYFRHRSF